MGLQGSLEQQDQVPGWLWHGQNPSRRPRQGSPSPSSSSGAVREVLGAVWANPSPHPNIPSLPSVLSVASARVTQELQGTPSHPQTGGDKGGVQVGTRLQCFTLPTFVKGLIPKELLSATWCRCSIVLGVTENESQGPSLPVPSTPSPFTAPSEGPGWDRHSRSLHLGTQPGGNQT